MVILLQHKIPFENLNLMFKLPALPVHENNCPPRAVLFYGINEWLISNETLVSISFFRERPFPAMAFLSGVRYNSFLILPFFPSGYPLP